MKKIVGILLFMAILASCSGVKSADEKKIFVTIEPLKGLVEELTCGDYSIEVLVPSGASPESYEPSSKQIASLSDAELIVEVGLIDFEHTLTHHINDRSRIINVSQGIKLIEGSCSHHHHSSADHHHGIDPHIWTSPKALKVVVRNISEALMKHYPDSTKYAEAAQGIISRLDSLDAYCAKRIAESNTEAMMIYHPAYTYLARDYNIEQISIEHEGKEPTPRQLTTLISAARKHNIRRIFFQPQYNPDKLRALANEIDAEITMCNPLNADIEAEILNIVDLMTRNDE